MDRRRSAVVLVWLGLAAIVIGFSSAQERPERRYWSPATYPNPQREQDLFYCKLREAAFVCDPNKILNPYEANVSDSGIVAIQDALRLVRQQTLCACGQNMTVEGAGCNLGDERGYTIAVALAEYMDLPPEDMRNEKALEEKAREFAMTLRQRWRFGQCDDDVVIFLSSGDMKLWTAVGSEAGKLLTPQLILSVSEEAGKLFKQKDYTRGLLQVIGQYKLALQGKKVNVSKDGPHLPLGLPLWLLIVIAVLIVIVIIVLVVVIIKCCCTSKRDYQMARRTS